MTAPRVLVTRANEDAGTLSVLLETQGLRPVQVPVILRVWNVDAVAELAQRVPHAEDVVLTSPVAAKVVATAAPQAWRKARFCAVGPVTARTLGQLGYHVEVVPRVATASALVTALGDVRGRTVVWPRSEQARSRIDEILSEQGAVVHAAMAYRNEAPAHLRTQLQQVLPVHATTLLSGSAAQRIAQYVGPKDFHKLGKIVVIGPSTRAVAEEAGLPVSAEATPHSIQGLVRAVIQQLGR